MSEEQRRIDELLKKLAVLEAEVERLQAENAELRRRLGQTSQNSHKPPSSDGYRKKSVRPALPKPDQRAAGGQVGHTGKTLHQVSEPDQVQVHLPVACSVCGRAIGADEGHALVGKRQVFDLPEPRLEVIEHRLGELECCGQVHTGQYPGYVTASVQYGPGVRALVTKLSVDHKMPLEQIGGLFSDLYGYALNSETVERTLAHGHDLMAPLEAQVREELQHAPTVHFDETGLRVAGKLHWLHTAGTASYTYLFVHAKRGQKALHSEKSVLKDFTGYAIHDCLTSYFSFTEAKHGLCHAHLLRELHALTEAQSPWVPAMRDLLLELHQARPEATRASPAADRLRQRYHQILRQADEAEPPPKAQTGKGRPKNTPGRNLLRRLQQHEEAVLAFARVAGVPFTNNLAERDLRPAKVKQKVSGCFRTIRGADIYARLQAMIATCRKQGRNIFATLRDIFSGQPVSLLAG